MVPLVADYFVTQSDGDRMKGEDKEMANTEVGVGEVNG